jgi:hypothetical protein
MHTGKQRLQPAAASHTQQRVFKTACVRWFNAKDQPLSPTPRTPLATPYISPENTSSTISSILVGVVISKSNALSPYLRHISTTPR